MKKRWIGYAAWLLLAACLYFFENNTGTRVVLLCSALFPMVPALRRALFSPDEPEEEEARETWTVRKFVRREAEEPGEIRLYLPGDPVRNIHWKLSAKKDELLVRDAAAGQEAAEEEERSVRPGNRRKKKNRAYAAAALGAGMLCCAALFLVPEARRGLQELCNRLFAASEAVNRYAYQYFTVPENQGVLPAAFLLAGAAGSVLALAAVLRSRLLALGIMAAATGFQVYFGLSFPAWINLPLYGLLALWMLKRPVRHRQLAACCSLFLLVTTLVVILLPGTDSRTEAASEAVRDFLARTAGQMTETLAEVPGGGRETRHIHTRSMESGDRASGTEREFRLVTVEEEQISMPHWVNWLKIILLLLLTGALVFVPFTPFLLLNARQKKAQEIRKAFASENVSEAVQAVFRQIIRWLEATGYGAGNLLYRDWEEGLQENFPEAYTDHFARCAADYEEAVYSGHTMPEQKRRDVLDLLEETETALWAAAGRRKRIYLKYWMCLHE